MVVIFITTTQCAGINLQPVTTSFMVSMTTFSFAKSIFMWIKDHIVVFRTTFSVRNIK
jgi:hypothetical protein